MSGWVFPANGVRAVGRFDPVKPPTYRAMLQAGGRGPERATRDEAVADWHADRGEA